MFCGTFKNKSFTMLSSTTTFYSETATYFGRLRPSSGHQLNIFNEVKCNIYIYIYIYIHSPYGFTQWNPTSLQCLLQYEVVKSGRIVVDGTKIFSLAYFPSPDCHSFLLTCIFL